MDYLGYLWIGIPVFLLLSFIVYAQFFAVRKYRVDTYFIREILKDNKDFRFATIVPYYTSGYYLEIDCGKEVYEVNDLKIPSVYGAKVDEIQYDLARWLGTEKGLMKNYVKKPNYIIIRKKDISNERK